VDGVGTHSEFFCNPPRRSEARASRRSEMRDDKEPADTLDDNDTSGGLATDEDGGSSVEVCQRLTAES
jgi:hypothetical protein